VFAGAGHVGGRSNSHPIYPFPSAAAGAAGHRGSSLEVMKMRSRQENKVDQL